MHNWFPYVQNLQQTALSLSNWLLYDIMNRYIITFMSYQISVIRVPRGLIIGWSKTIELLRSSFCTGFGPLSWLLTHARNQFFKAGVSNANFFIKYHICDNRGWNVRSCRTLWCFLWLSRNCGCFFGGHLFLQLIVLSKQTYSWWD